MNIYKNLNDMINFIETNLEEEIDYNDLAKIVGVNSSILKRIFPLISGITLTEYIKKRRLSLAGREIIQSNSKIIDLAVKYGYENATSFSRAFYHFHGIKPSDAKKDSSKLNYYPKLVFNEPALTEELSYEIIELPELKLYGLRKNTDIEHIEKDAPTFFQEVIKKYPDFPEPDYGMIMYQETEHLQVTGYALLWKENYGNWQEFKIPSSRYLKFKINSLNSKEIRAMSQRFYLSFLPECKYHLRYTHELEYYHDGTTDFLVPID